MTSVRVPRERPKTIRGITERVRTAHGNAYITINIDDKGKPFEVFTTIGKAGSTDQAYLEAISRLISLALRSGIPAVEVVEQLRGITSEPVWDQGRLVKSAPDAVALAMATHALGSTEPERRLKEAYAVQSSLELHALTDAAESGGNGNGHATAGSAEVAGNLRCPDCNGRVLMQEGCVTCPACGWNLCG